MHDIAPDPLDHQLSKASKNKLTLLRGRIVALALMGVPSILAGAVVDPFWGIPGLVAAITVGWTLESINSIKYTQPPEQAES